MFSNARKTESRDLDGIKITCTQFGALKSLGLKAKLMRYIVPVLATMGMPTDMDQLMTADLEKLAPALVAVFARLADGDAESLAAEILAGCEAQFIGPDGVTPRSLLLAKPEHIDIAFGGDDWTLILAMKFAIEVNFAGFTERAKTAIAARKAEADAKAEAAKPLATADGE